MGLGTDLVWRLRKRLLGRNEIYAEFLKASGINSGKEKPLLLSSERDNPQAYKFVSLSLASGKLGAQLRVSPIYQEPGRTGQH